MVSACSNLQRAGRVDLNNLKGMDCLAAIYNREKRGRDLESLTTRLMEITEIQPESWVAFA